MQGIITIAVGSGFYGHLAEALAKSVKRYTKLPISIIADEDGLKGIANPKLFDHIYTPPFAHVTDQYAFNPFKLKTYIYGYSPYEETLYIDADNIFIKEADDLFEKIAPFDFQIHEVKRWDKDNRVRCAMIWSKKVGLSVEDLLKAYDIDMDAIYPEYNSSFIWFKKTDKNKEYFKQVNHNYINRKTDFKPIGRCYPDEMAWNITSAQLAHYGGIDSFKPIYHTWENGKSERVPPVNDIKKKFWILGMAGGFHTPKLIQVYELLTGHKFDERKKIFHRK